MNTYGTGIMCPIFDVNGKVKGYQISPDNPHNGAKYLWPTNGLKEGEGKISSHLPNGELPITFLPGKKDNSVLFVCEGTIKPYVASRRHDLNFLGASGGNFTGSPEQVKEALALGFKTVAITPDGGDVKNPQTITKWEKQIEFFQSFDIELKVAWWNQLEKEGCDIDEIDNLRNLRLISTDEFLAIAKRYSDINYQAWKKAKKFTPHHTIHQRFFDWEVPKENTILHIKSDMGTGKTQWLIDKVLAYYKNHGGLGVGCRNALLLQFCTKSGFQHISDEEAKMMVAWDKSKLALCADSLHRFEPEDFDDRIVILDEVVSVIRHLLFSKTIKEYHRPKIIKLFKESIRRAKIVICLDGNHNDATVKLLSEFCPEKKVVKVENTWKKNQDRELFIYEGSIGSSNKINANDTSGLIGEILDTPRPFIVTDSQQKGEDLDKLLSDMGSDVLRVDSKTSQESKQQAFLQNPDKYIQENRPDAVILSPTAESGLDISIKGYFSAAFTLGFGTLATDQIRQLATRLRDESVPTYCWLIDKPRKREERDRDIDLTLNECYQLITEAFDTDDSEKLKLGQKKLKEAYQEKPDHVRFLAWRNKTVNTLNNCVREHLWGKDAAPYVPGDRLIARKPLFRPKPGGRGKNKWRIFINNSEEATVTQAGVLTELKFNREIFHYWEVMVQPEMGGKEQKLLILHEDSKELHADKVKHYASRKQWSSYFDLSRMFDDVGYAYALTVHKAQGSTIDNVFLDVLDMKRSGDKQKLLYTALTRTRKQAFVLS